MPQKNALLSWRLQKGDLLSSKDGRQKGREEKREMKCMLVMQVKMVNKKEH